MAQRFSGETERYYENCHLNKHKLIAFLFQEEFKTLGGTIHENELFVSHEEKNGAEITVTTKVCSYTTNKLIYTVGCWITKLFPNINFEIKVGKLSEVCK